MGYNVNAACISCGARDLEASLSPGNVAPDSAGPCRVRPCLGSTVKAPEPRVEGHRRFLLETVGAVGWRPDDIVRVVTHDPGEKVGRAEDRGSLDPLTDELHRDTERAPGPTDRGRDLRRLPLTTLSHQAGGVQIRLWDVEARYRHGFDLSS
jgi:hypothetical protein